jgi:hypothetical protein
METDVWQGRVARWKGIVNAYKILVETPHGKRTLGRPRVRWENIKVDLMDIWWDSVNRIQLAQIREQ